MGNYKNRYNAISEKRYRRRLKSKQKKKNRRIKTHKRFLEEKKILRGNYSLQNLIDNWMSPNIKFLLSNKQSDFNIKSIQKKSEKCSSYLNVPKNFSLIENPRESFEFIQQTFGILVTQTHPVINIDYSNCKKLDLGAQVLLDIILKEVITFLHRCNSHPKTKPRVKEINGINIKNEDVGKLLFSVGSPAILTNKSVRFRDVVPYKLCIHNRERKGDPTKISEQKNIDTTNLVDYVIQSLRRVGKTLTPEKLDDLCVIISEILINAEEHSTTKHRFSIGYFQEKNDSSLHFGVFRLVILNFGETIYEKFKSPHCPNKETVIKMTTLSKEYTKRNYFLPRKFEEETLWTLYALQEGVTSVAPEKYKKRGNGSIRFIESFFNLRGKNGNDDLISKMAILSGKSSIIFDGKYQIVEKHNKDREAFKYMTFNDSGNIEEMPDKKYVKFVDDYFPGTIISAKILFKEDDLRNEA